MKWAKYLLTTISYQKLWTVKQETRTLIYANILGFFAVIFVNYMANALPLGGRNTGELSDLYPNLIVPAGVTFSIWGLIYTWLGVWIVFQIIALFNPSVAAKVEPGVRKSGYWFALSSVFNIAWLFAWHYQYVFFSAVILAVLFFVVFRLNLASKVGQNASSKVEQWAAHPSYGLYQGWLSVALVVNVTTVLVNSGWRGGPIPEMGWAIIMILIAALLALITVWKTNNVFHGLAVVWALIGIFLKPYRGDLPYSIPVGWVAIIAGFLVLLMVLIRFREWHREYQPENSN